MVNASLKPSLLRVHNERVHHTNKDTTETFKRKRVGFDEGKTLLMLGFASPGRLLMQASREFTFILAQEKLVLYAQGQEVEACAIRIPEGIHSKQPYS